MDYRRPNECPRCGFAYTAFNRPASPSNGFWDRFTTSLREQRRHGVGVFGKARYAEAVHVRPWQCRCGTWLRAGNWSFGWIDVVAIAALTALHVLLASQFPWAKNGYVFATPIGLWVGYRVTSQVTVHEVSAEEGAAARGAG
jgi:hypothetical protein